METPDESKALVKALKDGSRKVTKHGKQFHVHHKFKDNGDVVTEDNYDVKTDLSKLNQKDLSFLVLWKQNKWNDQETLAKCDLAPDQAEKTFKKLARFKTEDARIKALASEATPERVLAKDMENIETGALTDSQHKSLDRVAKITGAFKTSESGATTINVLQLNLTPDQEKATKEFFDTLAVQP